MQYIYVCIVLFYHSTLKSNYLFATNLSKSKLPYDQFTQLFTEQNPNVCKTHLISFSWKNYFK